MAETAMGALAEIVHRCGLECGSGTLRFFLQRVKLGAMTRAIGALIALVVAAGCVLEDSTTPTQDESAEATTSVSATSTSAPPGEASPLAQRLLQPGELAGVAPGGPPQVLDSARAFASGRVAPAKVVRETARLRRLGFVVAIVQFSGGAASRPRGCPELCS